MKNLTDDQIQKNWTDFREYCNKLGDISDKINIMLDELEERFCIAPASTRLEFHNAFPGGLVDHSLRVMNNAMILSKKFFKEENLSTKSIVLCSLFHDLGKVGNPGLDGKDYYIPQDSQWHQEKLGEMYTYNKNIEFMTHAHRSIYVLQYYGIQLTPDEFVAILVHDGNSVKENEKYSMKINTLATCIQMADELATKQEKMIFA